MWGVCEPVLKTKIYGVSCCNVPSVSHTYNLQQSQPRHFIRARMIPVSSIGQYWVSHDAQTVLHMWYWPKAANITHNKFTAFVVWRHPPLCSCLRVVGNIRFVRPQRISALKSRGNNNNNLPAFPATVENNNFIIAGILTIIWQIFSEFALPLHRGWPRQMSISISDKCSISSVTFLQDKHRTQTWLFYNVSQQFCKVINGSPTHSVRPSSNLDWM